MCAAEACEHFWCDGELAVEVGGASLGSLDPAKRGLRSESLVEWAPWQVVLLVEAGHPQGA